MKSFTAIALAALSSLASVQAISVATDAYNADNSCKSADQVTSELNALYGSGDYNLIRTYGTDCNQVAVTLQAIRNTGSRSKLFAGIYDVNNAQAEAQTIIDAAGGDWSLFDTISVGNEGINDGRYTIDQLAGAVNNVRGQLQAAGFGGAVVTVDVFVQYLSNTALCSIGDYVAVNIQPYYDGNVVSQNAGSFVATQKQNVKNACGAGRVVVTEAGWPSAGPTRNQAVASPNDQAAAISSLRALSDGDLFLFEAFNSLWKSTDVERSFGFLGNGPSKKRAVPFFA